MTIQEAIERVDAMKPNKQAQELKVRWLSELDGLIWRELEKTHGKKTAPPTPPIIEDGEYAGYYDPFWYLRQSQQSEQQAEEEFTGYDHITDWETVLKAPFPYDEIYTYWLMVKIDHQNQEWDKYENDRQMFNAAWTNLATWWTREHMPKEDRFRHFRL